MLPSFYPTQTQTHLECSTCTCMLKAATLTASSFRILHNKFQQRKSARVCVAVFAQIQRGQLWYGLIKVVFTNTYIGI